MEKQAIKIRLEETHAGLYDFLRKQKDAGWRKGPEGKWTTGQHVLHLVQSIKPLNKALGIPKFFLGYKFGKANRAVRPYEQVVARYQERLEEVKGVESPFSKNIFEAQIGEKEVLIKTLEKEHQKLQKKLAKWSDKNLDKYILPHPLMGRMPIRELIMWTAYHTEHHTKILAEKYNNL